MKILLCCILSVVSFYSTAQITGTLIDKDNKTVNFATIYNLTKKTSSITNIEGEFKLEGNVGDSIRIQHLNYFSGTFIIVDFNDTYILNQKSFSIKEVFISASYASALLKKSCDNTYSKLKNKNYYRGYLNYLLLTNNDTTQIVSVDLDLTHRKFNNLNQGEKINSFSIQERVVKDTASTGKLSIAKYIGFPLNGFIWKEIPNTFNYVKIEDSLFIKIYLLSKKSVLDSIMNCEVIINKKDTCLYSIAITNKNAFINKKNKEIIENNGSYQYVRYGFTNHTYYLAEFSNGFLIRDPQKENLLYKGSIYYKTYQTGVNLKKRKKRRRIPGNIFIPNQFKNKYYNDFWKDINKTAVTISDFDYLFNFIPVE